MITALIGLGSMIYLLVTCVELCTRRWRARGVQNLIIIVAVWLVCTVVLTSAGFTLRL